MRALYDFVASGVSMQAATRYFATGEVASSNIEDVANAIEALIARDGSDLSPFVAAWHPLLTDVDNASEVPLSAASTIATMLQTQFRLASTAQTDTTGTDWLAIARQFIAAVNTPKITGQALRALRLQLPLLVREVLHSSVDPARVGYLQDLLSLTGPRGGPAIGTLNYDTTIETCARSHTVELDDGLRAWTAGEEPPDDDTARLYKMHGSISWQRDLAGHYGPVDETVDDREPAIIFGGRNKLTSSGPFMSLLWAWRHELMHSDACLVVGYSFRDDHINSILEEWLRRPARGGAPRMAVVDPGVLKPTSPFGEKVWSASQGRAPIDWPTGVRVTAVPEKAAAGISAGIAALA